MSLFQATFEDTFLESFNNDRQAAEDFIRKSFKNATEIFHDETLGIDLDLVVCYCILNKIFHLITFISIYSLLMNQVLTQA